MKYIVLKTTNQSLEREIPFIFPNSLIHADMAEIMQHHLLSEGIQTEPVAAGEISLFGLGERCGGSSTTLKLESRGSTDDTLISMLDYHHGLTI